MELIEKDCYVAVISNIYKGEGFAWIVDGMDEKAGDWRFRNHGYFENMAEAEAEKKRLNDRCFPGPMDL